MARTQDEGDGKLNTSKKVLLPDFQDAANFYESLLTAEGLGALDDDSGVIKPHIFHARKVQYDGGLSVYELCQEILRLYEFKKESHRKIIELHGDGKSEREIRAVLLRKCEVDLSQQAINKIINRIKRDFQGVA